MVKRKSSKAELPDARKRIVDAAVRVFKESGPVGVTLREIARHAKVDPPLIHYHFKSLDDLQFEVIGSILEELRQTSVEWLADEAPPLRRMKAYAASYFKWARARPELMQMWAYFYTLAMGSERYRELNTRIRREGRERIRMMIYEGIERREFQPPPGARVEELAVQIQGLITGNVIMSASEEGLLSSQDFEKQTVTAILRLLGANGPAER